MLSSDLEDNDRDRAALNKVLSTCLEELKLDQMVTFLNVPDGKKIQFNNPQIIGQCKVFEFFYQNQIGTPRNKCPSEIFMNTFWL